MAFDLPDPGITARENVPWIDLPPGMGGGSVLGSTKNFYAGTLVLEPGEGFPFHTHERQDEIIYVLGGEVEGWVGQSTAVLRPGDVINAPRGTVHALYNVSSRQASMLIVLSPLVPGIGGNEEIVDGHGWELTDVSADEPWASLRRSA